MPLTVEVTTEAPTNDGGKTLLADNEGPVEGTQTEPVRSSPRKAWALVRSKTTPMSAKAPKGDEHLPLHRIDKTKDEESKEMVIAGILKNRFCSKLERRQLEAIFETMEFYEFEAGDFVVKQGDAGLYFFVAHEGSLEVTVDDKFINTMTRGSAFGAIALLHNCPRTASVKAKDKCGVWGAHGENFRRVMKEHAQKRDAENRKFLDSISLFDGLPPAQKARIGELAILNESFEAGARVCNEGEVPTAMYYVMKGELEIIEGGKLDDSGTLKGGTKVQTLRAGDTFGRQALRALHGEPRKSTVVVVVKCELVCIGIKQLKDLLGDDLAKVLSESFIISVLKHLRILSHLSVSQQHLVVQAMETKSFGKEEKIDDMDMQLVVVIDGDITGTRKGKDVTLGRGQFWEDDTLAQIEDEGGSYSSEGKRSSSKESEPSAQETAAPGRRQSIVKASGLSGLRAGANGSKVAVLSREALTNALVELGFAAIGKAGDQVNEYMRKVLLAKKVPIFRNLSQEQIDALVELLVLRRYNGGAKVFEQGKMGNSLFVIASGDVNVSVNGKLIRCLGKGSCFGERALLFEEPRSATVEVISDDAEIWSVNNQAFRQVVTESMHEELIKRIQLQDTNVSLKLLKHVKLIGAGAFGSVRLVEHRETGTQYALKRIRKTDDDEMLEMVKQECTLLATVDHPFIIRMVKTFDTDHSMYILTELITGGQLFERSNKRMGVLNKKDAQFYLGSLVMILESLHERAILYRDLKPENVMLDATGYLKLVDFGIAKKLTSAETKTFTMVGTLYYMAPEIMMGQGYGAEVDVWSLGIMFYELVNGVLPFGEGAQSEQDICDAVLDDELRFTVRYNDQAGKRLIQGMLAKEPEKRMGLAGWADIKNSKYFKDAVKGNLFSKILSREITAPIVPEETYSDPATLETVTLSDTEELCTPADVAKAEAAKAAEAKASAELVPTPPPGERTGPARPGPIVAAPEEGRSASKLRAEVEQAREKGEPDKDQNKAGGELAFQKSRRLKDEYYIVSVRESKDNASVSFSAHELESLKTYEVSVSKADFDALFETPTVDNDSATIPQSKEARYEFIVDRLDLKSSGEGSDKQLVISVCTDKKDGGSNGAVPGKSVEKCEAAEK